MELNFMTAEDVAKALGISKSYSYKIIKKLNNQLIEDGYEVVAGKVSKQYFAERYYGMKKEE
ncbi:LysR family transcriptional regulator [Faecalibacillus intestinalis]